MFAFVIAASATLSSCPGAYIDYEVYRRKFRDDYVPVQVQVAAHRALRQCAKDGKDVPMTVAAYNQHERQLRTLPEVFNDVGYKPPVEW